MTHYRFYKLNDAGRIAEPALEIECADDGVAIARARLVTGAPVVEIWSGARMVERVATRPPPEAAE